MVAINWKVCACAIGLSVIILSECLAGMDFTTLEKDYAQVPKFRTTNEAMAYGKDNIGNMEVMSALYHARQEALQAFDVAINKFDSGDRSDHNDLARLALEGQLYREAMEAAGYTGSSVHCYSIPWRNE